ncbi:Smoothened like protein [Argiope bruennichi]|uniref:Smoothened like protein n=1 Tax=Argiope bruennichi TaxID=94029 RepID=A0A8T0FPK2_ARGBR|nr:Smoothened like protein [Argiope bruennichi]
MEFIVLCFLLLIIGCYGIENQFNGLAYKSVTKDGRYDAGICSMEATCEKSQSSQNLTCFGTELPYSITSLALAEDSESHLEVQDNLALWQGLRSIPRCWAVVQPLLCSIYMPKCENGLISLPTQEMCRITRGPCRAVQKKHAWPSFLRCENKKLFPPRCRNPLQEIKFNTSFKCIPPLVETDNSDIYYEDVDGCALQCQNPFYTDKEHDDSHFFIGCLFSVALFANLFTVITLLISSKATKKLPSSIILYINVCLIVTSLGWLAQFVPGFRDGIICNSDGTLQQQQPKPACAVQFIFIYYSTMAAITWCVILKYVVYIQIRNSGSSKDILKKYSTKLKLLGWSVPALFICLIWTLKGIDGDSVSGICFVGYVNSNTRLSLVLPIVVAGALICFFIISLCCLKNMKSQEMPNDRYRKKLRSLKYKICGYSVCCLIIIICTFACHAYDFLYRDEWQESLREFIVCLAMNSGQLYSELSSSDCSLKSKPNINVVRFHIFCMFAFSMLMSSWAWSKVSIKVWKRRFFSCCSPKDKSSTLKKHTLISEVFRKRDQLNRGDISLSMNSHNEDPVGINLDGSSVASGTITSSWARSFPKLMWRRNAVPNIMLYAPRHYSSASDISRHVSIDSYNQQNIDSQSLQISEQEYVLRHQRRKTRKERMKLWKTNRWFPSSRRDSDTSLQSSLAASIVAATAKNLGAKISKSTSTGDLGNPIPLIPPSVIPPIIVPQPVTRKSTLQREHINPPFTHGMTDNSHRIEHRNLPSSIGTASVRLTPNPSTVGVNVRYTPNPLINGYQNPMNNLIQPPMFGQGYEYMNAVPYGYMGGMCPGIYSTYSTSIVNPNFNYQLYGNMGYMPYDSYQTNEVLLNQYQPSLLPMHPRAESASETEYFPIVMSDSEFTDTGHRSYDEAQLMTTQRLLQERAQALAAAAAQNESQHPKTVLEPQACAKIQFLKRMDTCKIQTSGTQTSEPVNDRQSPHNEAPPPSPADSVKSLDVDEDDDDVFECSVNEEKKTTSVSSLPQNVEDEGIIQKLKSKFRRAISFTKNGQEQPEGLELSAKPCFNSLDNISSHKDPLPVKNTQKEKCLDVSEGLSLIDTKDGNENVSR